MQILNQKIYAASKAENRRRIIDMLNTGLPRMRRLPNHFRAFLNPEFSAKVYFYSLPLFFIPSGNGKTPSVFNIVWEEEKAGKLQGQTKYAATSGNAGAIWAHLTESFDYEFVAVVDRNVPAGKRGQIEFPGGRIEYPRAGESTLDCAQRLGSHPGCGVFDQYRKHLPAAIRGHQKWTWAHVAKEMQSPEIKHKPSVVAVPVGTMSLLLSATILRKTWPNLKILGVACVSEEERIPGARPASGLMVPEEDYRKVIDPYPLITADKQATSEMSRRLHSVDYSAGLTTGMALAAVCDFLNEMYAKGGQRALHRLCNAVEDIVIVIPAVDAIAPYLGDFATS